MPMHMMQGQKLVLVVMRGCICALLAMGPACGDSGGPGEGGQGTAGRWRQTVREGRYALRGDVLENEDLSAIACGSGRYCLIGADEGRAVQVVELSREKKTLDVKRTVPLLSSGEEIDIEAIAAEGDVFYIVGSHGISKKRGEHQENREKIFRLKVDGKTGVPGGLAVGSLARVIREDAVLGRYANEPLQQRGVNIEGLAVRAGRLFVGFRGPNLGGYAYVMEIGADAVFAGVAAPSDYTLHKLKLGDGLGIREIVAAKAGFLIIAGNSGSEPSEKYTQAENYEADRDFSMLFWGGKGPDVQTIGRIPDVAGKAEAMTILEESSDHVTVLLLFDGPKGGRPGAYRID